MTALSAHLSRALAPLLLAVLGLELARSAPRPAAALDQSSVDAALAARDPAVVEQFRQLAFGTRLGDPYHAVRRWRRAPSVSLPPEAPALAVELDALAAQLEAWVPDMELRTVASDGDIEVVLVATAPAYRVRWDSSGALEHARIEIPRRAVGDARRSQLRRQLLRVLGLLDDSRPPPRDSALTTGGRWTDVDRELVRLLYDARLPIGTPDSALPGDSR